MSTGAPRIRCSEAGTSSRTTAAGRSSRSPPPLRRGCFPSPWAGPTSGSRHSEKTPPGSFSSRISTVRSRAWPPRAADNRSRRLLGLQDSEDRHVTPTTKPGSVGADPAATVESVDAPVITSVPTTGRVAGAGDLEAIVTAALELHGRRLTAFARHAVRDDDEADDLVQETYLRFVSEVRTA